jgi:recombination associated protein RdgC
MKEIKNWIVYRLTPDSLNGIGLAQVPDSAAFTPCSPTQIQSVGFVPPRGEAHGALCEAGWHQHIYKLLMETRSVPSQAVLQRVEELAQQIERDTGRQVGRKQRKELKEQATLELLPSVISRYQSVVVWIDSRNARLILGTGSVARADEAVGQLLKVFPGLVVTHLETTHSPAMVMSAWLLGATRSDRFDLGRELVVVSSDEMRSSVRYDHHVLDLDEVRAHINAGKVPKRLALTWQDRVSFVLTDAMHIKKVKLLDFVLDGSKAEADSFDADMAIFTSEFERLLDDLVAALN